MTVLSATILLHLIALRIVFPSSNSPLAENSKGEPFLALGERFGDFLGRCGPSARRSVAT